MRATVEALGFKRRMQEIYRPITRNSIGQILTIKELVKVENLTAEQVEAEKVEKARPRNEKRGYSIVGNALEA